MITAASLQIAINAQGAQQATADLRGVGNAVETTGQQSATAASRFSGAGQVIRGVGLGLTASVTAPILALGTGIVGMASDSNEALSAVTTVYGSAAQTVIDTSRNAATAVGMSQTQYLSATTQLAAYGNMMGLTEAQTATFADQTVTAAADLASFYNTSPEDAMGAITAGLRGEGDALERYGIIMNQATVEAYALEQGIWDGTSAMTTQQLETARSGFIMSQLTDETGSANAAQGDFARTSGGLANQQRILKAELKDVAAQFGQVLLPIALKMVGGFQKVIGVMADMSPHAKAITVVIAGIAAAIGPALVVIGSMMGPLANGFRVARIAMLAVTGPIGLIVAALVGLGIAYKTNFLGFGDAVRRVGTKLRDVFGDIVDKVQDVVRAFRFFTAVGANPVQAALGALAVAFPQLRDVLSPIIDAVGRLTDIFGYFRDRGANPVQAAVIALSAVFPGLRDVFVGVYVVGEQLIDVLTGLWDAFSALLQGDWSGVFDGLQDAWSALLGTLGTAAEVIGTLLLDAIDAIDWAGIGSALLTGAQTAVAAITGMALDFGGWVLDVGIPAVGGWLLGGLTALSEWVFDALGDAAGLVIDFVGWTLTVAGPAVVTWLFEGASAVLDWIRARLGIGGVPVSGDGIPTGTIEPLTFSDWVLDIALPNTITWLFKGISDVISWIKASLGIGGVAASADGIPLGDSEPLTFDQWALNIAGPAKGIVAAGWDFLTMVAGKIAEWALAAVGWVLNWGGWSVMVGWATDIAKGAWDFLTMVASAIWGWINAAAGYVLTWAGWSLMVGWAQEIARGAWDFITNVATAIWGWIQDAAGYVMEWAGWVLSVGWGTVESALGDIAAWLNPYISGFLNGVVLDALNWALSIGVPDGGISIDADFNWTELAKAAFTGTIHLDPEITMDIKKLGAKFGSWLNGALQDPGTIALVGLGVAALVAAVFFGPELLLAAALALIVPPAIEAFGAFFEGVFEGLDFGQLMDGLTTQLTDGLADMIDELIDVLNIAPGLVPDGMITKLEGWRDDIRSIGADLGKDFSSSFTDALGNDYNPSDLGTGYQPRVDDPTKYDSGPNKGEPEPGYGGKWSGGGGIGGPVSSVGGRGADGDPVGQRFGGMFGGFITAARDARTAFTEVMTGITTDSEGAKSGVVASLTGMATEGLPQVTGLSTLSAGEFAKLHATGLLESTGLGVDVKTRFADMQLGASGSAGLTNTDVGTKLGTMKGTGIGHVNALSAQTLLAFNNLKLGATVAASTTSSDVVTKLGTMASGGADAASQMMSKVKSNIANSGAAGTAYTVGTNIGAGLRDGLNAMAYDVGVAAANIIGKVDAAMRKKAMIRSPSQMTQTIGEYIGNGLVVGLNSTVSAVGSSATAMIGAVQQALSSLGSFRQMANTTDSGGFWDSLKGVSRVSGAGTLNGTASTVADTMKVIAEHFDEIFSQGEYGSDALTALPTDVMSQLAMAVGKVMAPYEGNATVIESAYTALKNLVGDGAVRGAFALVPEEMQRGLVALAKNIRDTFANGNLPIATNLYAVLRETNRTILTAMTKQATEFRTQFEASKAAGGSLASKGLFGFGIANDAMAATLSDAGKQMLKVAEDYQHTYETSTNTGIQKVALDAVKRIGADFGKAGYSYRIFEDGSLVLDAVKALSAAAMTPLSAANTTPATAPPYVPATPAPTAPPRQPAAPTITNTYYVTIDAKNVEDFLRAVNFIDSLDAAKSLVYGSGGAN